MFYDKEIKILDNTGHLDENGLWVEGIDEIVKTIECDVQPYNKELSYRDYGFNEDVKYRIFCDIDDLLKLGTQVKYKDENYTVVNITDWDDYLVVLIDG